MTDHVGDVDPFGVGYVEVYESRGAACFAIKRTDDEFHAQDQQYAIPPAAVFESAEFSVWRQKRVRVDVVFTAEVMQHALGCRAFAGNWRIGEGEDF